jgi:hypothetical protein
MVLCVNFVGKYLLLKSCGVYFWNKLSVVIFLNIWLYALLVCCLVDPLSRLMKFSALGISIDILEFT